MVLRVSATRLTKNLKGEPSPQTAPVEGASWMVCQAS